MTIKAIIFDYGKVLTFPQPEWHIREMAKLLNTTEESFTEVYYSLRDLYDSGRINGKEYWQKVAQSLNLIFFEEKLSEELIELDLNSWFQQNNDVWKLVSKLKKNYKTALLSNNIHELVEKMERELELEHFFDIIIFSNRVPFIKPEPEIYLHCLEKLSVKPDESVFIDDKIVNIDAAESLGIKGILFTSFSDLLIKLENILGEKYE